MVLDLVSVCQVDAVVEVCVSGVLSAGHESMGEFIRFCGCAVVTMLVQEALAYGGGA